MSAKKFLDLLDQDGLLEQPTLSELRQQVAGKRVSAAAIAKLLVERGQLTRFQATKLVDRATAEREAKKEEKAPAKGGSVEQDDELGLAPLDEDEAAEQGAEQAQHLTTKDLVALDEADVEEPQEVAGLTPVEEAGEELTPVGAPASVPPPPEQGLTPLDDLFADQSALDSDPLDPFGASAPAPTRLPTAAKPRHSVWDTKLIIGGTIALALLVFFGVVLYVNLSTAPAVEMWAAAMEDYRSGSYAQAENGFARFLDSYPDHENASEGRVRIALCQIRQVLSSPEKGLQRSEKLLPEVEDEEAFDVARDELATMLIRIPQGFLERAKRSDVTQQKEELVALAEQAMELVNTPRYVPSSRRTAIQQSINEVQEGMVLVHRDINRDRDLAAAISEIQSAAQADETVRAYQIYKDLTDKYPGLRRAPGLIDALVEVTQREQNLVTVSEEPIESVQGEAEQAGERRVVLANRSGDGLSRLEDVVVPISAGESVYGLNAGSGEVLWSRFVGSPAAASPVRLSEQGDADVLAVDSVRQELVRIQARSGQAAWRLPVGEAFAAPVVAVERAFVSSRSGKLYEVDLESGASPRQAAIPLNLGTGPAVDQNRPYLFQVGEHSNVYVLSTDSLECSDVHYLGHKPGTVATAPLIQSSHLFVAENFASGRARLHVLALKTNGDEFSLEPAQKPIRLRGNVVVPLVPYGRSRIMVVTDYGAVEVYDVDPNKDRPVSEAANLTPPRRQPMVSFPLVDAGSLWIADDRLTKYRVQVTTKDIVREEITNIGDTFVEHLQLLGDTLVHTRRRHGSAGITVAAVDVDSPRQTLWQTHLGVPAAPMAIGEQDNGVSVVSAAGSLFEITEEELETGSVNQPKLTATSAAGSLSFTEAIEFPDGRVALFNPDNPAQLLLYDATGSTKRLQVKTLPLSEGYGSTVPIAFQGGLLAPSSAGEIWLLDLASGENQALPFQPKLQPGETIQWRRPAVVGEAGEEFVIVDEQRNVYRIGIDDQPQRHLDVLEKARLSIDIDSPLAAAGELIYGVVRAAGSDVVAALTVEDLEVAEQWDLDGERVTWGPQPVGDRVLVVTDDKHLRCFEAGQKLRWDKPATMHGRPAGPPLVEQGDYVFAARNGKVWRISGATGEELDGSEVGESLASGPVNFGKRLLVSSNGGALHVVPMPADAGTANGS